MKMTKTLALAALVAGSLLAGITLQAQDAPADKPPGAQGGPGGPGKHGPNFDKIAKELNLTDDQKTKMKAVLEEERTQMKALHQDTSLSKEERQAKMKEIRESTRSAIKQILTPEQLKKWEKHMQHNRPPGDKPEKKGGPADN